MSSVTIISEAFGEGACLYKTVLNVARDATPSQLRKAYYKKALQYHPDKMNTGDLTQTEKDDAKAKFQAISLAYTILSDEKKRAEYDESGDLYDDDDELSSSKAGVKQWMDYFKNIFPTVTTSDIDAFEVKYKCSDEEESDVLKYYSRFQGDLNQMLEYVMLSSHVDKQRWVDDYINPAVKRGDVNDYSEKLKITLEDAPTTKRRKVASKCRSQGGRKTSKIQVETDLMHCDDDDDDDAPTAEIVDEDDETSAENAKNKEVPRSKLSPKKKTSNKKSSVSATTKRNTSSEDDLFAQIKGNSLARRQRGFDSMMMGIEERYGGSKNKGMASLPDDIPDDEFEKIQTKMMNNRRKK